MSLALNILYLNLNLKEVWDYRDLVYMFVKEILSLALNKPFWDLFGFYQPHLYYRSLSYCIWQYCQPLYRWRS